MLSSKAQADKWHLSDAMAGLTLEAGGGPSGNHVCCFNIFRGASEPLETELNSSTATLNPQIWNLLPLGQVDFPCWVAQDRCICRCQLEVGEGREALNQTDLVLNPGYLVLAIFLFSGN